MEISKSNSLKGKVTLLSLWDDESFFLVKNSNVFLLSSKIVWINWFLEKISTVSSFLISKSFSIDLYSSIKSINMELSKIDSILKNIQ